jgi:peptidylprolyl isomerase
MLVFDVEVDTVHHAPPPPDDVAAVPQDAKVTESGLAYRVLRKGDGEQHPGPDSMVHTHFSVWRPDGSLIDTTQFKEGPVYIRLDRTLPGFAEIFPMMVPGERRLLWISEEQARVNEGSRLPERVVIDVELLHFTDKPVTPPDVETPPESAERTATGVAYRILRPGGGERHPQEGSTVEVHYAGWTTDGQLFDASYDHRYHGTFTLDDSMPAGWNEALQMMVEGEKRRIWIPEELAYNGEPDRPAGMLVFDVELLAIRDE